MGPKSESGALLERSAKDELHQRVTHDLTNHAPRAAVIGALLDEATSEFLRLAHFLVEHVPPGRELSTTLTKIEEASMWAKAGIARNQSRVTGGPDRETY